MCGSHDHSRTGNLEGLKRYLDFYNNPTIECLQQCLYIACSRGHLPVVKYLVEEWNVDPLVRDSECIQIAGLCNHSAVVAYLTQSLGDNSAK